MSRRTVKVVALPLLALSMLTGCQTNSRDQALQTSESQVALRSMQSRAFETNDKPKTLRTIIATLQDLGFVIDKADETLGTISGTKLNGYSMRMTVSVRDRGSKQTIVRANAQYNATAIEDPQPYQQFFAALGKSMFLTAQQVD
jgi:hypothetical protein